MQEPTQLFGENNGSLNAFSPTRSVPAQPDPLTTELYKNFKEGDLLYGLRGIRKPYRAALQEKVGRQTCIIVDEYNSLIAPLFFPDDSTYKLNETAYHQLEPHIQQHHNFLTTPENKQRFAHYSQECATKRDNGVTLDNEQHLIQNLCKIALHKPDITIHFCLDNIDISQIFSRETSLKAKEQLGQQDKHGNCYYDLYTSAELRHIVGSWEKGDISLSQINFYNAGQQVKFASPNELRAFVPTHTSVLNLPPTPCKKRQNQARRDQSTPPTKLNLISWRAKNLFFQSPRSECPTPSSPLFFSGKQSLFSGHEENHPPL